MRTQFYIKEFGLITYGEKVGSSLDSSFLTVDINTFNSLISFIEENQFKVDLDKAFTVFQKRGQRFIKVKNYVGVIETKDQVAIEILPKTYINVDGTEANVAESRNLLLTMLKTLKKSPFINLSFAHLKDQPNFPILEVFVSSYLDELSILLSKEFRGDYLDIEENIKFLKGKLLVRDNLRYNIINKTNFFCNYQEFKKNIPPNKLIKSTLFKLKLVSHSSENKKRISKYLQSFEKIDKSFNIDDDLKYCNNKRRLLSNYGNLLNWSEIFLKNRSFTNFSGNSVNQAILFPMERLFESYIAHLINKHCDGISIRTQDRRYFLVGQKNDISDADFSIKKFLLKPDVVLNNSDVIIDTKWKLLNSETNKYNIKEGDIYQMHAYGSRYSANRTSPPRLALIYPSNPAFKEKLLQFRYGNDMYLDVIPFNFGNASPKNEINSIINLFF